MKKTVSIVSVVAVAVVAMGMAQAKEWKEVRVATEGAYAPWNSTDASGKLIGFDIDVINEICKRQSLKCTVQAQAWKGIIPGLTAGKYDAIIAGMQITTKRKKSHRLCRSLCEDPRFVRCHEIQPLRQVRLQA